MKFCYFYTKLRVNYEPITSQLREYNDPTTRQYRILLALYIPSIYPAILKNTIFPLLNANTDEYDSD